MSDAKQPTTEEMYPSSYGEKWRAYRYFIAIMWRANPWLAASRMFLLLLNAILQPLGVYSFSLLISAIAAGNTDQAPWLIGFVIGIFAIQSIANGVTHSKLDDWFSKHTALMALEVILDHLSGLDPERLLKADVQRDLDFVREDLWRLNNLASHSERVLSSVFKLVGAIALSLVATWWVAVIIFFYAILESLVEGAESRNDIWDATWNSLDGRRVEYARYVFLAADEFRELRLLDAATRFVQGVKASGVRILSRFRRTAMTSAKRRSMLAIVHATVYGVVIFVLGWRTFGNPAGLATLYIAINLFSLMNDALSGLSSSFGRLYADLGVLTRVHHLLQIPKESDEGIRIPKAPLVVEFDRVSYRYPGATKDALHDTSLTIREGEHLAIVGENGAGKSTFLRLLSGLDRPTAGRILVNGKSLETYRKSEWRRAFHLMLQGARLYQDFIRENLTYGESTCRRGDTGLPLDESVVIAGADAVIRDVPSGLEAFIGDWAAPPGVQPTRVSGGQAQRLLIARTLIHGGRILGFDEPTSAMDARAEASFFERLHEAMKGRGLIFISHRFSTVRRASRILVFHSGTLTEEGTHEELLTRGGEYAKLYAEQAKWYV